MERRTLKVQASDGRRLEGYVVQFNTPATIEDFTEYVKPGAFARTLARGEDVRALYDHTQQFLLGRTKSKTLALREDGQGLRFSLDVPNTTVGNDVLELVSRGDISGASFGFTIPKGGDHWRSANGKTERDLLDIDLAEITITPNPAYASSNVSRRSQLHPALTLRYRWLSTL